MVQTHAEWKKDLRLLRNLVRQYDRDRGRDLSTIRRSETGKLDVEALQDLDNLKQALLLRFLTEVGELTDLGHPNYGSKLFKLIGELNTETNRNRAKLYVLEALGAEPRVKEVLSVDVRQNILERNKVDIDIELTPIGSDAPVTLTIPFSFEGGVNL